MKKNEIKIGNALFSSSAICKNTFHDTKKAIRLHENTLPVHTPCLALRLEIMETLHSSSTNDLSRVSNIDTHPL